MSRFIDKQSYSKSIYLIFKKGVFFQFFYRFLAEYITWVLCGYIDKQSSPKSMWFYLSTGNFFHFILHYKTPNMRSMRMSASSVVASKQSSIRYPEPVFWVKLFNISFYLIDLFQFIYIAAVNILFFLYIYSNYLVSVLTI